MIKQFSYVIAIIMIIAQYSETHAAAPYRKVVIGHAAMNARVAPLWVAEDHGFFTKYGVNANAIFIRQAPVLVAALTADDVQAAYTGGTTVLPAVAGGSDCLDESGFIDALGRKYPA